MLSQAVEGTLTHMISYGLFRGEWVKARLIKDKVAKKPYIACSAALVK